MYLKAVGDEPLLVVSTCYGIEACGTGSREGSITDGGVCDVGALSYCCLDDSSRAIYDDAYTDDTIDGTVG